ncbi:MAG: hydrogenase maturation protease [Haloarculaceae archaeon]
MTEEVVVGVGNPIMGDDGLGKHVVDALLDWPAVAESDVTVTHAGTTAFLALEALSGADRGIVVDALSEGDAAPGTVHRYRLVDGVFEGRPPDVFMHDFSFSEAVQAGSEAYDLPPEVLVLGVEPADTDTGVELSDPVAERLPAVVETVVEALETVDAGSADQPPVEPGTALAGPVADGTPPTRGAPGSDGEAGSTDPDVSASVGPGSRPGSGTAGDSRRESVAASSSGRESGADADPRSETGGSRT